LRALRFAFQRLRSDCVCVLRVAFRASAFRLRFCVSCVCVSCVLACRASWRFACVSGGRRPSDHVFEPGMAFLAPGNAFSRVLTEIRGFPARFARTVPWKASDRVFEPGIGFLWAWKCMFPSSGRNPRLPGTCLCMLCIVCVLLVLCVLCVWFVRFVNFVNCVRFVFCAFCVRVLLAFCVLIAFAFALVFWRFGAEVGDCCVRFGVLRFEPSA